jgi:hypothetical protein
VDPAATQGSIFWWLVGAWLACNAIVPVVCLVSMGADYLRRKFSRAPARQEEGTHPMAAD